MFKKNKTKNIIPDIKEFVDDEGKKWVQTSTDDIFSLDELNNIIQSIDREKDRGELILARIDFQNVNKEYYEAAVELQKKLVKQNESLKKIAAESKSIIERKNKKLKELIEYIKKLHAFLAYVSASGESLENIELPSNLAETRVSDEARFESAYEDVVEVVLSPDGKESGPAKI